MSVDTALGTVSIILPTLGRPTRLLEVLTHTRATSPLAGVIVVTPDVESQYIATSFGYPFVDTSGSAIQKWNAGAATSCADWLALGADDTFYLPGWFEAAMAVNVGGYVGLRDKADRYHEWFEHYCLSRAYINAHMGGCLMIPAYASQYADVEASERAKRAGVAIGTAEIVVEHRHWSNGGAAFDSTYQLSRDALPRDEATFHARRAMGFPDDFEPVMTEAIRARERQAAQEI